MLTTSASAKCHASHDVATQVMHELPQHSCPALHYHADKLSCSPSPQQPIDVLHYCCSPYALIDCRLLQRGHPDVLQAAQCLRSAMKGVWRTSPLQNAEVARSMQHKYVPAHAGRPASPARLLPRSGTSAAALAAAALCRAGRRLSFPWVVAQALSQRLPYQRLPVSFKYLVSASLLTTRNQGVLPFKI